MKRFSILTILITCVLFIVAQEKDNQSPKDMFLEAESYLLYEEYTEALPLFLKLSKADPENDNLNFKVGLCYLSVPYEKERAIVYLEKAVKNIDKNYKPNNFKETRAPLDALFYLGNAYRINNQLDKAIDTYNAFKKQIDPEVYDEVIVDEQIAAIERAKRYQSKPVKFTPVNIGEPINSKFAETNAVVSSDEKTLVYNVKLQFYDALYYAVKEDDGKWSDPINIIPELGVDGDVYATSLSSNGKELYIYRSDNFDGNIYVTRNNNGRWTPIKKLNENINTRFWESHASISSDGKALFFTSNRKGGYGGLDIYQSTRDDISTDNWKRPINLGGQINTSYNEETPFITDDGTCLYFSSYGHFNMGGYDIFYSNLLENDKWSAPLNMGYPINTTDDDVFFVPVKAGKFAYISRYYSDSYGKTDVYRFEIFNEQHPRKFILKGLLSLPVNLDYANTRLVAYVVNKINRDTVQIIPIDPKKARFDSKLIAGNYQLVVQGNGLEKLIQDFTIDKNQNADEFTLNANMHSVENIVTKQEVINNEPSKAELHFARNVIKISTSESIAIPLDLPQGSKVTIQITVDSVLKQHDNVIISKKGYAYLYKPVPGKNLLRFSAQQPDNVIKEGIILIIFDEKKDSLPASNIAMQKAQLQYARILLSTMASKQLSKRIKQTSIESENLNLEEYAHLLKSFAEVDSFSSKEIDSLIALYEKDQPRSAQLLLNALMKIGSPQLIAQLNEVCKNHEFKNIFELTELLVESEKLKESKLELVAVSSRLADNGNAYYYLTALKKVASEDLIKTLDKINLRENKIQSPADLLNYLYQKQAVAGYTSHDIYTAFFSVPLFTTPADYLNLMANLANEPMFALISKAKLNEKLINNGSELGELLMELSTEYKVSEKDILNLYLKTNTQHFFNSYKDDIGLFSLGKVKDLLSRFSLDEAKADSTNELLNWLLRNSDSDEFKDDLIRVFSQIAAKNLLNADNTKFERSSKNFSAFNLGIISVFAILFLIIIAIYLIKKNKKE